jgi:glycine oxidase
MAEISNCSRTADVIIIGGGLIGSSIALRLAEARLKVLVLDRGEPGGEASSAAAGMIAPQGETLEPDAFFAFCASSHALYPSFVTEIEELSGRNVGYHREGTLLVAVDEAKVAELEKIYWAQTRSGLPLERLTPEALQQKVPGLSKKIRSGLGVSEDHWVDSEGLMRAVIEAARRLGVTFCAHCPVRKLNLQEDRVESLEASSDANRTSSTYSAEKFVLAAGCWSSELLAPLGMALPMQPCRGQMLEFDSLRELPFVVRAGIHYLVPRAPKRILVGTTAEYAGFEKAITGEGLRSILNGATRIMPLLKDCHFRRAWAGLRPDTPDHLPILGYGELENLILATGHFRNGILLAPLTAQLTSELLLTGSTSQPIEAYRPTRFAR